MYRVGKQKSLDDPIKDKNEIFFIRRQKNSAGSCVAESSCKIILFILETDVKHKFALIRNAPDFLL